MDKDLIEKKKVIGVIDHEIWVWRGLNDTACAVRDTLIKIKKDLKLES